MKLIILIIITIIIIPTIFINAINVKQQEIKKDINEQSFHYDLNEDEKITFIKWTNKFNKIFSYQEFESRFEIFKDNKQFVEHHNSNKNSTMVLGLNEFSHFSHSEFLEMFTITSSSSSSSLLLLSLINNDNVKEENGINNSEETVVFNALPNSVDWLYITPTIHNQGICGCGYAFAAASALENIAYRKNGKTIDLSVQQLLDCTRPYGNNGCGGGFDYDCFEFVKQNGGIVSWEDIEYTGVETSCPLNNYTKYAQITGYVKINEQNKFTQALAVGVISASLNAEPRSFQMYVSGVYDDPTCGVDGTTSITVSAVGYGVENGIPYYKIKNSWGKSWGMEGTMKLKRDICLIAKNGVGPIMTKCV